MMTNRQIFLLLLLLMTRMMIAFQLNYVRMGSLIILGNVADSDFLLLLFFGGDEITRHSLLLHCQTLVLESYLVVAQNSLELKSSLKFPETQAFQQILQLLFEAVRRSLVFDLTRTPLLCPCSFFKQLPCCDNI